MYKYKTASNPHRDWVFSVKKSVCKRRFYAHIPYFLLTKFAFLKKCVFYPQGRGTIVQRIGQNCRILGKNGCDFGSVKVCKTGEKADFFTDFSTGIFRLCKTPPQGLLSFAILSESRGMRQGDRGVFLSRRHPAGIFRLCYAGTARLCQGGIRSGYRFYILRRSQIIINIIIEAVFFI